MSDLYRVVAIVAELGFAAAHVPALGADPKVEPAAAVLARVGPGARRLDRDMLALLASSGEQPHRHSFPSLSLQ
jgi:hypothetical protein